jgi:hypothetical protein
MLHELRKPCTPFAGCDGARGMDKLRFKPVDFGIELAAPKFPPDTAGT